MKMTTFPIEKQPGFGETRPGLTIPGQIDKLGYKGVETTEMVLDGVRLPADAVLGGPTGRGQGCRGEHGQAAGVGVLRGSTQESFRIHGGYGYSKEYEIERLMREAPFLPIGEGTSEIQKTIISRGLLREYGIAS
jgi:alkylation response protein AidB-like acyl-CoA dehydrogenase